MPHQYKTTNQITTVLCPFPSSHPGKAQEPQWAIKGEGVLAMGKKRKKRLATCALSEAMVLMSALGPSWWGGRNPNVKRQSKFDYCMGLDIILAKIRLLWGEFNSPENCFHGLRLTRKVWMLAVFIQWQGKRLHWVDRFGKATRDKDGGPLWVLLIQCDGCKGCRISSGSAGVGLGACLTSRIREIILEGRCLGWVLNGEWMLIDCWGLIVLNIEASRAHVSLLMLHRNLSLEIYRFTWMLDIHTLVISAWFSPFFLPENTSCSPCHSALLHFPQGVKVEHSSY